MTRAPHLPELLAPAGDREALKAALLAGADAVYLGGTRFSARASAANFDADGMRWARRATRRLGKRMYVAFNTLLFDHEWPVVEAELDFLEALAPDAIIVQDLGLLETLRRRGSNLPRHLSTQGAWDGAGGASLLRELGVERIILPRETPLADIRRLVEDSPFELEIFIHGAHCYSVSGRCQWSVHLGPRSGNRGSCAQPCRRTYEADGKPPTRLFSPKDLRLIHRMAELQALGIAAFKIEGRLKNAASIRRIVAAYRAVLDGKSTPAEVSDELELAFSRESCEGFLDGPPESWRTEGAVGHRGLRVGTVVLPADASGRTVIEAERPVRAGMGLSWNEPDGLRDGRRGGRLVWASGERGTVEARFLGKGPARSGVALYVTASELGDDPTEGWDPKWDRAGIGLRFEGKPGEPLRCSWRTEIASGVVESSAALQESRTRGLESILAERFEGLGEELVVDQLDVSGLGAGLFLPPKELKEMRREILAGAVHSAAPSHPEIAVEFTKPPAGPWPVDYSVRVFQKERVEEFLREPEPPLGWVLPLECASRAPGARYWIPWVFGPRGVEEIVPLLDQLPDSELLCFSWEAFELAAKLPRHRFHWTAPSTWRIAARPRSWAPGELGLTPPRNAPQWFRQQAESCESIRSCP